MQEGLDHADDLALPVIPIPEDPTISYCLERIRRNLCHPRDRTDPQFFIIHDMTFISAA